MTSPLLAAFRAPSELLRRGTTFGLGALAVVAVVGIAVANALISSGPPLDFSTFGPAGAAILQGRWGEVFGDPTVQAGPLELGFWGIPYLLGVTDQASWAVFFIVADLIAALAFGLVVERALRSVTTTWSAQLACAAAALAALSSTLLAAVAHGHPAQIAVPILWLGAGLLARSGRPALAAALLASSAGWEVWGLLGVPVLLLAPRVDLRTIWRSAVGGVAVVAVMFLPFALAGPFRMFGFEWPLYDGTLAHLLVPDSVTFPWGLRLAQGALSVAAGVATALLLRRSPDALWLTPLAVCAVRLLLDPMPSGYYSLAPAMLVFAGLAFSVAQRSWVVLAVSVLTLNVLIDFVQFPLLRAVGFLVLAAVTVPLARRAWRRTASRSA